MCCLVDIPSRITGFLEASGRLSCASGGFSWASGGLSWPYGHLSWPFGSLFRAPGGLSLAWKPILGVCRACLGHLEAYFGHLEAYLGHLEAYLEHLEADLGQLEAYLGHLEVHLGHLKAYLKHLEAIFWQQSLKASGFLTFFEQQSSDQMLASAGKCWQVLVRPVECGRLPDFFFFLFCGICQAASHAQHHCKQWAADLTAPRIPPGLGSLAGGLIG